MATPKKYDFKIKAVPVEFIKSLFDDAEPYYSTQYTVPYTPLMMRFFKGTLAEAAAERDTMAKEVLEAGHNAVIRIEMVGAGRKPAGFKAESERVVESRVNETVEDYRKKDVVAA